MTKNISRYHSGEDMVSLMIRLSMYAVAYLAVTCFAFATESEEELRFERSRELGAVLGGCVVVALCAFCLAWWCFERYAGTVRALADKSSYSWRSAGHP